MATSRPSPHPAPPHPAAEDYYSVWEREAKEGRNYCPCKDATTCIASIHGFPSEATSKDLATAMRHMSMRGYK